MWQKTNFFLFVVQYIFFLNLPGAFIIFYLIYSPPPPPIVLTSTNEGLLKTKRVEKKANDTGYPRSNPHFSKVDLNNHNYRNILCKLSRQRSDCRGHSLPCPSHIHYSPNKKYHQNQFRKFHLLTNEHIFFCFTIHIQKQQFLQSQQVHFFFFYQTKNYFERIHPVLSEATRNK